MTKALSLINEERETKACAEAVLHTPPKRVDVGPKFVCAFVGPPRSGTTLVASIIDAHPRAVVANEFDILQGLKNREERDDLLGGIWRLARHQAAEGRMYHNESSYLFNAWHGCALDERPIVIGDKSAAHFAKHAAGAEDLVEQLADLVQPSELKLIAVVRDPFETIETMLHRRNQARRRGAHAASLGDVVSDFANLTHATTKVIERRVGWSEIVYLDDLVRDAGTSIERLRRFLGLGPTEHYWLEPCAAAVTSGCTVSPRSHRDPVDWLPAERARVIELIESVPRLNRYRS